MPEDRTAYCVEGCGRPARTSRPLAITADGDLVTELICWECAARTTDTERVHLVCHYCFHWEKGRRTKDQIADWLRVHHSAGIRPYDGDLELASTCPHPCGKVD